MISKRFGVGQLSTVRPDHAAGQDFVVGIPIFSAILTKSARESATCMPRHLASKSSTPSHSSRASLAGMIAYAEGFDPDFINSLLTKICGRPSLPKTIPVT